jgi:hypothetical protein
MRHQDITNTSNAVRRIHEILFFPRKCQRVDFFKDLDIRYRYTKSSDVDTSAKYKHPTSEEFPS